MPRWLARVLASLCAATVALTLGAPASGAERTPGAGGGDPTGSSARPTLVLDRDYTLELRDLFVDQPHLGLFDRVRARTLLARPTAGDQDPGGDGYRRSAIRRCGQHVCVHAPRQGADAPPSIAWLQRTLRVMNRVWRHEVDTLGFRAPPSDGRRGGDDRFDVYLSDVGARGLFGYCTPERLVRGERRSASGYCVLDNDFARRQYDAPPRRSLQVTAAHEFFHAIQFGYDFREDPWLLESTAVWVEETFADAADDSRRYLRYGTVRRPGVSLDTFSNSGYAQYGNWPFWEFLAGRYGQDVVRQVWARADATRGAPGQSSIGALRSVLTRKSGPGALREVLTAYAVANLDPSRVYDEGAHWPSASIARRVVLDRAGREKRRRLSVDHLAARHLVVRPATEGSRPVRRSRDWRLHLDLSLPPRAAVAVTVVRNDGRRTRRVVTARESRVQVPFDAGTVSSVIVTAVNASARYDCFQVTTWSCNGKPLDDGAAFVVRMTALRDRLR
ncbi:hypothetical protein FXB39_15505 [Nocardioides sp. BGMRC 2183]|nr:hypothetical protein FXB39_15505 [Nocardioides sp. BGMRC 2183]